MFGLSLSKKIKLLTVYVVDIALLCVALAVACCYRCSVVCVSVCLSVCLLVTTVSCLNLQLIKMPFG